MSGEAGVRLFIKNLLFSVTEESVSQWLQNATGSAPTDVVVLTGFKGRLRGRAFVRVSKDVEAKALALNGTDWEGRSIIVELAKERPAKPEQADGEAKPRRARKAAAPADGAAPAVAKPARAPAPARKVYDNATQLYVNNLDFAVTTDELRTFFQSKLNIEPTDVEIVTSKYGKFRDRSRGFGFVVVPNANVAAALALEGSTLHERQIGVQTAKERPAPAADAAAPAATGDAAAAPRKAPRRRGPRKPAAGGESATPAAATEGDAPVKKPRNRTRKPKADASVAPASTA